MRFITLKKEQNNYSSVYASSALLHSFFTSNSVVSLIGNARLFLAQDAGYPSYATGSSEVPNLK